MEISEKERRIYYQGIVYAVCNIIDRNIGSRIVCGTVESPSTDVQDYLAACNIRLKCDDDARWVNPEDVNDLGLWWWWNGEYAIPVEIGSSRNHSGGYDYFAYSGQHGWTRGQDVTAMGGKWQRAVVPEGPSHAD